MKKLVSLPLVALFLFQFGACAASTSWKGTVSKDWRNAGNWTAGVPTVGLDAIIGDANFTGANQPDLSKSSVCKSLTIGAGSKVSTLKVDQTFTISGNVLIGTNGTITHSHGTMSLSGNWTKLGAYTASGNGTTVAFSGATQSLAGLTTFRKLSINASSTTVLETNVTVINQLTVSGRLDPNESPTRIVSGAAKLVVNSGGRLQVKAATFAGNYALTGAKTLNVGSTVDYAATLVNQTINNTFVYGTLRISGALTKALTGNLPALASSQATTGNLVVDGGILDLAAFSANRGATLGGTLSVANGATLRIGGTNTIPANYRTHLLGPSSTVEFYGAVQTVPLESYGNLALSTSSGAITKTMPAAPMTIAGNLTSSATGGSSLSFTAGGALSVSGNVSIGAGTTFNGNSFSHTIGGNWANNGGFVGSSGSVFLSGNGASITGTGTNQFNNLNLTGMGVTAASTTSLSLSGDFTTSGAGTFTHLTGGSGTVTLSGASKSITGVGIDFNNLTVTGSISTTTTFAVAGNLQVSGALTANGGTITLSGSGKTISGAGSVIFNGLSVPGAISTPSSFTIKSDLFVTGTFAASAGTATFAGVSTLSGAANLFNVTLNGSRLQLGPAAVLGIAGNFAITSGTFDATSTTPNTVNYNGAIPQTVVPVSYYNLSISGGGIKLAGGALIVFGDVNVGGGATFNASPSSPLSHSIYGNWINAGTFAAGSGTIELLGGQDTMVSGPTTFNTLTLNKNSTAAVVTLDDDVSVSLLNMTRGDMHTGTNTVTITSDRVGNGIILGTITRTHAFLTGTPYAFEGPFNTINFTSGSAVSSVTVNVVLGPVRDFPFGGSINRQYTIGVTSGTPYTTTLRLHYLDIGLNGNSESSMGLWRFGGPWAASGKTSNDATDNWVEQSSLTNIVARWTISDDVNAVRWSGTLSSAWENAGNWVAAQGSPHIPPSTNDIVELASIPFVNHPRISTPVSVRTVSFGSVQPITLTLDTGSALVLAGNSGNITGIWTNNATHTIDVGPQVLTIGGVFLLSDGTNGHAINLNIGSGSVSVAEEFTQSGGASLTFTDAGELEIAGDFNYVDGTFTAGAGTVRYLGSTAQIVAGGIAYNNLSIEKSAGVATLSSPATLGGDLTLSSNSVLVADAGLGVDGNVVIGSAASLQGGASTISVGGDWIRNGTFTPSTGTVLFDGTGPQSIGASTFNNLTINKAGGTATPTGNLLLNGDLHVFGILDLGPSAANRSVVGGNFTLGSGATLRVGAGFPLNFGAHALATDSIVEYVGSGAQTVSAENYGHLYLSNGGANAKTLTGSTSVAGDLLVSPGATFAAGAFVLEVQGNWLNNGTFLPGGSSVTLSGISKNVQGTTTFNNLAVSGGYSLLNGMVVNGTLNLSGTLSCGSATHVFGGDFFDSGALTSSGTITFPGTGSHAILLNGDFSSTGTVNFNGAVATVVGGSASPTFLHININNTGGVSCSTDWKVNGDFFVASGATFTAGATTDTFEGSFNNQGTVSSTGTLEFVPANPVTITLRGTAFSSVGQVIFGGTGTITVAGGPPNFSSVTIANSTGVTPTSNWTVTDNILIEEGALLNGGAGLTHTISGNWTGNGVFDGTGSTVLLNGDTELAGIGSTIFNRLLIAGNATATTDFSVLTDFVNNGLFDGTGSTVLFIGTSPSTISGTTSPTPFDSLTIDKSSATTALVVNLSELTELTVDGGTLDVGSFAITQNAAGGILTVNGGTLLRIGGTGTLPVFDSYLFDPASTVEYYGTGTQTIAAANYGNLASSSTGARILPAAGTVGIAGSFIPGSNAYTVTGSTIDFNGDGSQTIPAFNYNNLVSSLAGARILAPSGTIRVAGTFTPGANSYTVTNSTINFNGGAQSVPAFTYFNFATSGSGTKTLAGDILVSGSLSLSAALADGGFTATVAGNADNESTHSGTGKILLAAGAQEHALSGSGSYRNLELNDQNGAALIETNLTVTGTLTFTSGNLSTTATNKVIVSPAGSVARASGHVIGHLQKNVPTGTKVTNTFEIGDAASFTPVTLVLSNVTVTGNLTASTTPGIHPDITNSVVSATRGVNRYWTITNSSTVFNRYDALFNFVTNDVDFGASPTNFIVAKRDGGVWTYPAISNPTPTNILAAGMTNFSEYVVGDHIPGAPPTITTQPQSQNVNLGGTATFSVEANTGAGTLTYQWLFNGNPVPGANNSTLIITNVDSSDAGSYSVVIDNGSLTNSAPAILTLNQPPTLTPITDRSIDEGSLLTIATSASDPEGGPLSYTLLTAPSGASISTNGVITWTPTEAQGPGIDTITVQVTDNGVPTGLSDTESFTVTVNDVNNAPVLTVPSLQTVAEQTALSVNATATDSDPPPDTLTFALVSGPAGLTVSAAGAIAWTPTEAQGPSTNTVTVRVFDNGTPTLSATNSFQVIVTEVNTAPLLTLPATQTIPEQITFNVNATATDSDQPNNPLTFALVSGPLGLTVSAAGAIAWTPTEAQGPSTNTVTVRVADNGTPTLSATNSFQIIVTEVNTTPLLTLPATQTIAEQTALNVTATATDSDQPTNSLTFSLVAGPTGLTVSGAGAIAWTPTEAQGPSTNTVTVRVADNGTPTLSANNSFQIIVDEVNTAPLLTLPTTQTIAEQTALSVNATATDADQPTNTLTFALVSGPTGLTVSTAGVIAWTPTEAQGPSTNAVTVRVFDNGTPTLSATNSFQVVVTEVNAAPLLTLPATQTIAEQSALNVNATATDSDQPTNALTFALVLGPTGLTVSSAGVIAWTPTEAQGPSTNSVTVRVADNGTPTLSATNSFQVIVTELNTPPVLAPIADRTNSIGETVTLTAIATDSDSPTNTLLFSLGTGAPAGATIDANSGVFNWVVSAPSGSTNTLAVIVSDNGTPSMSSTQTFRIVAVATTPPTARGVQIINGNVEVTFEGIPGQIYTIEATQNLNPIITWTPVASNLVADSNGLFKFVDTQTRSTPMRFFRARTP